MALLDVKNLTKRFGNVTMLFSDIVGFTAICSQCSPLQVITMLNALYTRFDRQCGELDVYMVGGQALDGDSGGAVIPEGPLPCLSQALQGQPGPHPCFSSDHPLQFQLPLPSIRLHGRSWWLAVFLPQRTATENLRSFLCCVGS